jgi:arsenate reductase (thioredoxin)
MAEAYLNRLGVGLFEAQSAGTEPGVLNPLAVQVMAEEGIDISGQRAKPLDAFLQEPFDHVVTVCDDANETCPVFPNARHRLHWSFPDPSRAEGTAEQRLGVFRAARNAIRARIEQFLAG